MSECHAERKLEAQNVEASEDPGSVVDRTNPETQEESTTDAAPVQRTRKRPESRSTTEPGTVSPAQTPREDTEESRVAGEQGGWGYWGSWGKSIMSTASATVASVGQGISNVIEKAESSLGIPSPEDLSAQVSEEEKAETSSQSNDLDGSTVVGGAMGMFSSLTSVVQSTGKSVITGGLDALEFIGKKTMDVIAEGDPGFKKTKGLMMRTSTLSQVLREAKEREEKQIAAEVSSDLEKKAHYGMLFDEFQGLSHLEALEILSRESEAKVKSILTSLSGSELAQLKDDLDQIKAPFALVEFDDEDVDENRDEEGTEFAKELTEAIAQLQITTTVDKLSKARRSACEWVHEMSPAVTDVVEGTAGSECEEQNTADTQKAHTVEDVHRSAITSLAELTARSIEHFHKVAELILHSDSRGVTAVGQASVLSQITIILCKEISLLSKKYTACLTAIGSNEKGDVLNPLITAVFLEASNSASYIQDAFQLLLPVLQMSHICKRTASTAQ